MGARWVALVVSTLILVAPSMAGAYTVEEPSKGTIEATEHEAERAAQEQKEMNERAARAAQEAREAEERKQREAGTAPQTPPSQAQQPEAPPQPTATIRCVVPSLKGDSLSKAASALRRSHFRLGKVHKPHTVGANLVVVSQQLRPGAKLAAGTAVAVVLARSKHAHR